MSDDTREAEDQSPAAEKFQKFVDSADFRFQTEECATGIRDLMLELFKNQPKPWSALTEDEQIDIAASIQEAAEKATFSVAQIIAKRGQTVVPAQLEQFTGKGGEYKIVLKSVGGPLLAERLAELGGKAVLVVHADAGEFYGVKPAETEPDAPELFNEAEPTSDVQELEEAAD